MLAARSSCCKAASAEVGVSVGTGVGPGISAGDSESGGGVDVPAGLFGAGMGVLLRAAEGSSDGIVAGVSGVGVAAGPQASKSVSPSTGTTK